MMSRFAAVLCPLPGAPCFHGLGQEANGEAEGGLTFDAPSQRWMGRPPEVAALGWYGVRCCGDGSGRMDESKAPSLFRTLGMAGDAGALSVWPRRHRVDLVRGRCDAFCRSIHQSRLRTAEPGASLPRRPRSECGHQQHSTWMPESSRSTPLSNHCSPWRSPSDRSVHPGPGRPRNLRGDSEPTGSGHW